MSKPRTARRVEAIREADILPNTLLIGIDCGVKTGFALAKKGQRDLVRVESMTITKAMAEVLKISCDGVVVFIEDARLRTWFTGGKEKAQGAGSIKRDCGIWEQFCIEQGIPFKLVHPANNNTKLKSDDFNRITGWRGVTNEHARDAAMLVFAK